MKKDLKIEKVEMFKVGEKCFNFEYEAYDYQVKLVEKETKKFLCKLRGLRFKNIETLEDFIKLNLNSGDLEIIGFQGSFRDNGVTSYSLEGNNLYLIIDGCDEFYIVIEQKDNYIEVIK